MCASIEEIIKNHTTHEKSLKDEESKEAYNEEEARIAFGDEFIDALKEVNNEFCGDWWQLALLRGNEDRDRRTQTLPATRPLTPWRKFRAKCKEEYIHLEGANLTYAHLEKANLVEAHLEHADLRYAHLEHADLSHVRLGCAALSECNLDDTDVRFAKGLLFDGNRVTGIRIEGNAPDPWSKLRRTYTGPWFFVHLLLLAVFFAPYVGKAVYLSGKSHFQQWSFEQYQTLGERLPEVAAIQEYQAKLEKEFHETHEERWAVLILLGLDQGFWAVGMAMVVIFYNLVRGFLTLRVSALRDAEERSSTTPNLWEYYGYSHPLSKKRIVPTMRKTNPLRWPTECIGLYRLHVAARVLMLVAFAAVLYNTIYWVAKTKVWVPIVL
ncbi:MAG: pentapeptide repeat-containing protein [Phycisphaerae bacterium]